MSGDFGEEDMEPSRGDHGEVVTLGFGMLVGLLFLLLLVCALCFGLGYFLGHRGVKAATVAASTSLAEQQPSQTNASVAKPSVIAQNASATSPAEPASVPPVAATTPAPAPAAQLPKPQAQQSKGASAPAGKTGTSAQKQPAISAHSDPARPAFFMVQIAAVATPREADVMVNALRKLKYSATAQQGASDNLIHVRMGPFASRAEADEWRTLLANDGYKAVVQP